MPSSSSKAELLQSPTLGDVELIDIKNLHFDPDNPRFGGMNEKGKSEKLILKSIVEQHGVGDVISSLSQNGYFESEPLVGRRDSKSKVTIIEGNRRLAALLILNDDPRASEYAKLRPNQIKYPGKLNPVPVLAIGTDEESTRLLAYLGVKHIVGAMEWDSYAKAAWVARVLDEGQGKLTLADIEAMFGDTRSAIRKMLEGFYFVSQVENTGKYIPIEDSMRRGRGSNTSYPFSWVYNILAYTDARKYVGLETGLRTPPKKKLLEKDKINNGVNLLTFMFGHKRSGKEPAIKESRDLSALADCLSDSEKVTLLEKGRNVDEVERATMAGDIIVKQSLIEAKQSISSAWDALPRIDDNKTALELLPLAQDVRNIAVKVRNELRDRSDKDKDDDED